MIFNVIQDNAYPPPHLFYQAACKREPLSTRLVTRTPTHKWLAFRTHCVDPRIHGKRNERYEATVYIYPARNQQLDSVEIFVACPTWAITRIRPSFITTCSSILADLTVSLVEEEDTRVEPSRFCDGLFSRVMTHVHALFQPLIFRPFSQVSLPLPSLVTVSLSFLFLSFFSFHLSLSLPLSSPFSPAHFPSELRARRLRRHEHACVNRPILLQLCIYLYTIAVPRRTRETVVWHATPVASSTFPFYFCSIDAQLILLPSCLARYHPLKGKKKKKKEDQHAMESQWDSCSLN